MNSDATVGRQGGNAYRTYVLVVLILVYIFNFIDRQILGILAPSIKAELNLTDSDLGWLGGWAFALFYTAMGVPIAMLADRFSRTWIITVSLAVWSGFTALCGAATSFWQLFLCRLGVGVGEAGGVAPAYSLIADYFPPKERARALAAYSFGIPIGMSLGILFGGLIAHQIGWRWAFIICGLTGLALAPLLKLTVKEPARGGLDAAQAKPQPASLKAVLSTLSGKLSFWLLAFGASFSSVMGYGLAFWLPSFFQRSHDMSLVDRSLFFSAIVFIGGLIGVWLGGSLGDRLGAGNKANYARVPATAFLISLPFFFGAVNTGSPVLMFFLFVVPQALALMWLGPTLSAVQHLVPANMRATASAIFLFINNLIGIGFGTWFLGKLSDILRAGYGDESLRYSILYCLSFYALAAILFFLASRRLDRDWHRE
ncbi:MFS transporter [alpha proteobacterium AAP38]|uniref:spinster family MFS transporter n=1 Tax=Niveispirillum sp. TaxID=1917217 RepID=UPI0006B91DCF|nr:MFS transporter [alpha proteobacterium AAP38]